MMLLLATAVGETFPNWVSHPFHLQLQLHPFPGKCKRKYLSPLPHFNPPMLQYIYISHSFLSRLCLSCANRHLFCGAFVNQHMDLGKFLFSDQFMPRRKVVSGFSLGVVASLVVLSVVLLNFSSKAPLLSPVFPGLNSIRGNTTTLLYWPFSLSTSSAFSSSAASSSSSTEELPKFVSLSEKENNGSFAIEEGRIKPEAHSLNGSDIHGNLNFTVSNVEGAVWERTHLRNSSERGGNLSSLSKPAVFSENSSNGKNKVNESDNVGNHLYSRSNVGSPRKEEWPSSKEKNNKDSQSIEGHNGSSEQCDYFDGGWVRDYTKPNYPAASCLYIDRDFDCHLNGRQDDGFLKWRWQPYGCDIPSFNATDFLERLRGKKLVFVGDSLNRNMWESLVCTLRHRIQNKKRVYEISGRRDFKKKGFYAFRFEDYNCTVDFVSSPFLVRESSFKRRNHSIETLRLDLMDRTTAMYHDADVIIFNTGHWWTHEKTSKGEDYYQEGNHVYPRLKVLKAYKKAITTWARWVDKNIDARRTQVIFRGYAASHFSGGQWNSGGQCHRETEPIFNETHLAKYPTKMRALEHVLQEMKTPVIYLNISRLTDYRKDGHPSIYRKQYKTVEEQIAAEQSQDCSHWCLPGVPDTWNELLYASLLQAGKGSWRRS